MRRALRRSFSLKLSELTIRYPVGLQIAHVHFQCRGIHGDENVHRISGRVYFRRGEIQLETADTRLGAGRSANFRRIVRKGRDVIPIERDRIGELAAGDLHAVTGIPGEADDRLIDYLPLGFSCRYFRQCGHLMT